MTNAAIIYQKISKAKQTNKSRKMLAKVGFSLNKYD